jgi:hypothetical protein
MASRYLEKAQGSHSPDSSSWVRLSQGPDYFARLSKAGTAARQLTRRYVGQALARAERWRPRVLSGRRASESASRPALYLRAGAALGDCPPHSRSVARFSRVGRSLGSICAIHEGGSIVRHSRRSVNTIALSDMAECTRRERPRPDQSSQRTAPGSSPSPPGTARLAHAAAIPRRKAMGASQSASGYPPHLYSPDRYQPITVPAPHGSPPASELPSHQVNSLGA